MTTVEESVDVDLCQYLAACEGLDVLEFDDSATASDKARALRRRVGPDVEVRASYNKVYLKLKG